MKVADLEEELRQRASEREALKLAMRILEEENQRFRSILASASQVVRNVKATTPTQRLTPSSSRSHSRHSSKSSLSIPIAPSTPGSPHASPQYLIPAEPLTQVSNSTKIPATVDLSEGREVVQPQPGSRSLPPPLDVDVWADSPSTPYHTSAPPKTTELHEGPSTARLTT